MLKNFPGVELVCQLPSASFIKDLPLDVAVIFRFDKVSYDEREHPPLLFYPNANIQCCVKNYWGIMHNFRKVNPSPQLDEIIA